MMPYWTQRDGSHIPIENMTESHIKNALSLVRTRHETFLTEASAAAGYSGSGDGASYAAEQAMNEAFDKSYQTSYWIEVFTNELLRRDMRNHE